MRLRHLIGSSFWPSPTSICGRHERHGDPGGQSLSRGFLSTTLSVTLVLAVLSDTSPAQSLREQADKSGMLIGAAVNPARFGEASYAATLAREFNMIEPENSMKWTAL